MLEKKLSIQNMHILFVVIIFLIQCSTKKICSSYYTGYATASFYKADGVSLDSISFDSVFTKREKQKKNVEKPTKWVYSLYVHPMDSIITYFFCKNKICDTLTFSYRYERIELVSEECGAITEYILHNKIKTSFDSALIQNPKLLLNNTNTNVKIFY